MLLQDIKAKTKEIVETIVDTVGVKKTVSTKAQYDDMYAIEVQFDNNLRVELYFHHETMYPIDETKNFEIDKVGLEVKDIDASIGIGLNDQNADDILNSLSIDILNAIAILKEKLNKEKENAEILLKKIKKSIKNLNKL